MLSDNPYGTLIDVLACLVLFGTYTAILIGIGIAARDAWAFLRHRTTDIKCDASQGPLTVKLPPAARDRWFSIIKIDDSEHPVTIEQSGKENIVLK